ncbi:preprotein translocase subunit SecA [Mycoplasmopsis bovis]|uniref:Protein translocase subunit SecA n=6 Tax=Mycoplasmopsis bovis TaxID=28903 RepID=A0A2N8U228_MYCBV|nr:preprotein translocase subunit SecA [Mycoplasmopsis bovis]AEI90002.1 preprotein translocase subunit SecA [Mycoplasmopsis bovis Hubei-1]AFM51678.1 preprotein translocase subunit SecA [Mycoplasmopsis bovis HB0801]AMW24967.1 preprotein translocase subunit SecA [Mycoplasmopsis bovis]AMW25597.1 preprotein translocase subunit SecA [Mycoplasmopsis bovis]AMW26228.1 preprotein translocase subunit SecA [Mycoplasmopsis bovis]
MSMNLFKSTEMRIAERVLKKINQFEPLISKLTNEELKNKTIQYRARLAEGESLDKIRPEAFAVCREATKRILGKRPYDVQMLGGVLLDLGSIAEMKTGEGKTITSIAPVYLNALSGKGAIVSTVNEYLAQRDAEEMGQVFTFLGLSVGINRAQMDPSLKREAYACDITYSIHSELGFDYLRDNMASSIEEKVQRGLHFCLTDEADSILIDEAKTPLIISGGQSEDSNVYLASDQFVRTLDENDYEIDEETKAISLTFNGVQKANRFFNFDNLYDIKNSEIVHRIQNALRAHKVMKNNVEYIVRDGKIELVDAFTGRIMEGRSYSEGLQQAIQAKEMVEIEPETKTMATITYQNFFRMFDKLCGMTGTAKTEEQEFIDIYNMRVNVVPTNKPVIRQDLKDSIYASYQAKWMAVVEKVKELYEKGQPVLVGTAQIEDSELLHELLINAEIPHTVLNAKQNASEAEIISHAGQVKAVTIATNMAGRGTDIKPSPEALALGGLYVLGTDKAESRRIDNQLRGRSGRQGDPGVSKFFLSIDDQLMRRFSNYEEFKEQFKNDGDKEVTTKSLLYGFSEAQKKIEGFNYDTRKNVLHYDDVIRQQRDLFYAQRDLILINDDIEFVINRMIKSNANSIVNMPKFKDKGNIFKYHDFIEYINETILGKTIKTKLMYDDIKDLHDNDLLQYVSDFLLASYHKWRDKALDNTDLSYVRWYEKNIILRIIDKYWQNHIDTMDKLRSHTNLVQYAQKNPYQVYTQEGSKKFDEMLSNIAYDAMTEIFKDRLGAESLITSEMENDPIFRQLVDNIILDDMPDDEREELIVNMYKNVKSQIEQNINDANSLENE